MAFAPGPPMSSARWFCAAVPVDARHVLVIAGQESATTELATTELLDVATMEFSPGPTMLNARGGVAAVRLDAAGEEPRILVLGGSDGQTPFSTTEVLEISAEERRAAPRRRQ
jgi:UDP-N-acetylglucosamine:LPS N-acetylglucosamine transferase